MPKRYRTFGTTADVGVASTGHDMKTAFENQAAGMFSVMTDLRTVRPKMEFFVEASGRGPEMLLASFLEELLFLFDTKGVLLSAFDVVSIRGARLRARTRGEEIDHARHAVKTPIKAVTYHRLEVRRVPGGFRTRVVYDI